MEEGVSHKAHPRRNSLDVHKPLRYFKNKFPEVEAWQIHLGKKDYITQEGIRVAPVTTLLERFV